MTLVEKQARINLSYLPVGGASISLDTISHNRAFRFGKQLQKVDITREQKMRAVEYMACKEEDSMMVEEKKLV